jgi:hypothetical protein
MNLHNMGAFPWRARIIITVLLVVVPAFSETVYEFLRTQEDPLFSDEKVVSERLQDGKRKVSVRAENSQYDSYMSSASNEDENDSQYMYENIDGYDVQQSLPHRAEDLIQITPSVPLESAIPSVADFSRAPSALQPMTESPPEEELLSSTNLPLDGSTDCICVDYYLCGANNTIITNGEGGLINVR